MHWEGRGFRRKETDAAGPQLPIPVASCSGTCERVGPREQGQAGAAPRPRRAGSAQSPRARGAHRAGLLVEPHVWPYVAGPSASQAAHVVLISQPHWTSSATLQGDADQASHLLRWPVALPGCGQSRCPLCCRASQGQPRAQLFVFVASQGERGPPSLETLDSTGVNAGSLLEVTALGCTPESGAGAEHFATPSVSLSL